MLIIKCIGVLYASKNLSLCIFEISFKLCFSSLFICFMYCYSCKYVNIILKIYTFSPSNLPFTPSLFTPSVGVKSAIGGTFS